jgi:hypothetical protein
MMDFKYIVIFRNIEIEISSGDILVLHHKTEAERAPLSTALNCYLCVLVVFIMKYSLDITSTIARTPAIIIQGLWLDWYNEPESI